MKKIKLMGLLLALFATQNILAASLLVRASRQALRSSLGKRAYHKVHELRLLPDHEFLLLPNINFHDMHQPADDPDLLEAARELNQRLGRFNPGSSYLSLKNILGWKAPVNLGYYDHPYWNEFITVPNSHLVLVPKTENIAEQGPLWDAPATRVSLIHAAQRSVMPLTSRWYVNKHAISYHTRNILPMEEEAARRAIASCTDEEVAAYVKATSIRVPGGCRELCFKANGRVNGFDSCD